MRSLTCAISLLLVLCGTPQLLSGQAAKRFVATPSALDLPTLDQYFSNFQVVELPAEEINDYVHTPGSALRMHWLFPDGMYWPLRLEPSPVRTSSFTLGVLTTRGRRDQHLANDRINTFKGDWADNSVRLTINDAFIYGYVQLGTEEWYIEPLKHFVPDATETSYLIYRTVDVIPQPGLRCGQTETDRVTTTAMAAEGGARGGCLEVKLAVAADYSMYEHYGSAGAVLAHVEGIINNVNGNFDDDFSQGLFLRINELVVPSCTSCDPWYEGQQALNVLESFKDWSLAEGFQNNYDLGQFWSRRNYVHAGSGSVIGLAYQGVLCNENGFHILEDFTASAGYLRVMTAHEIGHNFGCSHNYTGSQLDCYTVGRPPFIMDPTVNLATEWSRGEWGFCETNAVDVVDNYLNGNNCLEACGPICRPVEDLVATIDASEPAISLEWSASAPGTWQVLLEDQATGQVDTFSCNTPFLLLTDEELDLCSSYLVRVVNICDEENTNGAILIHFNTDNESKLKLESLRTVGCTVAEGTYTLELLVRHETISEAGFTVMVDTQAYPQSYGVSPQLVSIPNLPANGNPSVAVKVFPNVNQDLSCGRSTNYRAPATNCTVVVEESFDDCRLPIGWQSLTDYASGAGWLTGDSTRQIANFGGVQNTINGSCMLYFDDDILGPFAEQTGTAYLYSPVYDFEDYESIALSLQYNFNAYYTQPYSHFTIEVYDGNDWVNVLLDSTTNGCLPSAAWQADCLTSYLGDLSVYANAHLQIRFGYTDGGQWAEFVALDDFRLEAIKRVAPLPVEWGVFTADAEKEVVNLQWTTVQERNNEGFYIERSRDGILFDDLGFVPSHGDHHLTQAYFYADLRPLLGTSYYRLRQEDLNGDTSFSEMRSVNYTGALASWEVYPNPVGSSGQLQVIGLSTEDYSLTLTLYSASGQWVRQYEIERPTASTQATLDLTHLPQGVYFLRDQQGKTKRIVI